MRRMLNLAYGAVQGTYWMYYGAIMSFASVFLLGKHYSNSEIGLILAAASILAVILQPILADAADKSRNVSLRGITSVISVGLIAATAALYLFPGKSLLLSILFVVLGAWLTSLQPLINSMAFDLGRCGYAVNFGATRAGGSVAYAVLCAILGSLVTAFGIGAIPAAGIVILLLMLLAVGGTDKLYKKAAAERSAALSAAKAAKGSASEEAITMKDFLSRNRVFLIFSVSVALVFFQNSVLNTYLLQILTAIGGNSGQMGRLFSFMALLELPGLFFFSRLREKFTCQFMLKVASVAFVAKIFLVWIAPSVSFIYLAFLLQLISFPIFLSGSVHLVDEVMSKGEAVKGQAFITGMITLSNVFASLLGGVILDLRSASLLLMISTVLCVIGTIVVFLSVDRIRSNRTKK